VEASRDLPDGKGRAAADTASRLLSKGQRWAPVAQAFISPWGVNMAHADGRKQGGERKKYHDDSVKLKDVEMSEAIAGKECSPDLTGKKKVKVEPSAKYLGAGDQPVRLH